MPSPNPQVELLWWAGCRSWEEAVRLLRDEMAAAGLDPDRLEVRELGTDEEAERERFVGSPTIRVDGRDVQDPGGLVEQPCGVDDITVWMARSRYFGITPVGDGGTRWFAQLGVEKPLTSEECTYERLQEAFADFCEPLPEILKLIGAERQFHCGPAMSVDSPRWYDRRVLLVGDAAHALSPISGQGAAMAFEDAVVLAEELASTRDLESSLASFERRRRTRIEALRQRVANRVARAVGGAETQTSEPFSPDPWSDQASLLSTPY